jgi:glycosyltransferase involved in cell wall biosynthesis
MPVVSVILPNFNHASYLKRRIDSILNQTYRDFELIILDDCSFDQSKDVIENYRHHPMVTGIYYNERNTGSTFIQWDKGIQLAKGEYIWIAESDDYCEQTFLSELITPLIADSNLVIAFCQSLFVTPDEKIINKTEATDLIKKISGEEFLKKYMLGSNAIANVSMAVFRKNTILSISPEYRKYKYCGDWFFYASMCLKGSIFISCKYLNYYLRHENSVTSNLTKMGYDFFEGNRVFHFIKNNVQVNDEDITRGLNERIDLYIKLKDVLDAGIKQNVLKSVLELDPSAQGLLRKRLRWLQIRKTFSGLKKIITS